MSYLPDRFYISAGGKDKLSANALLCGDPKCYPPKITILRPLGMAKARAEPSRTAGTHLKAFSPPGRPFPLLSHPHSLLFQGPVSTPDHPLESHC